jgi:hypothetical protein
MTLPGLAVGSCPGKRQADHSGPGTELDNPQRQAHAATGRGNDDLPSDIDFERA